MKLSLLVSHSFFATPVVIIEQETCWFILREIKQTTTTCVYKFEFIT